MTSKTKVIVRVNEAHNADFGNKVFTCEDITVNANAQIFYLLALEHAEQVKVKAEIEKGFNGEENEIMLNEINCCIRALENEYDEISDMQKRRVCIVSPFINEGVKMPFNDKNGFTKKIKADMRVLSAKYIRKIDEYIKLENDMNANNADLQTLQARKKEVYASSMNILQNFYDIVCGDRYVNAKHSDNKALIKALQEIGMNKKELQLEFSSATIGKTTGLMLKTAGNTLAGKSIKTVTNESAKKAIKTAEDKAKAHAEKEQAEKAKQAKKEAQEQAKAILEQAKAQAEAILNSIAEKSEKDKADKEKEQAKRNERIAVNKAFTAYLKSEGFTDEKQIAKIAKSYTMDCKKAIME